MDDGYREPGTGQLMAKGSNSRKGGGSEERSRKREAPLSGEED